MDGYNALQTRLGNVCDASVLQMLSEQHTEIRSGHGTGFIALCEVNQGQGGFCGEEQSLLPVSGLYGQEKLVRLRLGNLVDAPAQEVLL